MPGNFELSGIFADHCIDITLFHQQTNTKG